MNVENILKVADAIEQHSISELGFNMAITIKEGTSLVDRTGYNCNTVACIAGWAVVIDRGLKEALVVARNMETCDTALEILDISEEDGDDLFTPPGYGKGEHTPVQAVRTLRHLAATGEVDWDLPDSSAS